MAPVRCLCGRRMGPACESQMFYISYGTRMGPVWDPQACRMATLRARKGIDTTRMYNKSARSSYVILWGRTGPPTAPAWVFQGLFTIY